MSNELVANNGGNEVIPSFLQNAQPEGFDDVNVDQKIPEIRVCTSMSNVLAEGQVPLKNLYIVDPVQDLGEFRDLLIFKYRTTHQLFGEDGQGILCKSYDQKTGEAWPSDKMDPEAQEILGVTMDDIDNNTRGICNDCNKCPFRPDNWSKDEDDNWIPPRCQYSHELYVLDLTEGFDTVPKLIRITETSKIKKQVIKDLNSQINHKLKFKGLPIYGGVFRLSTEMIENSRGKKNPTYKFEFNGYVENEEVFNFGKQCLKEFDARQESNSNPAPAQNQQQVETKMEEQKGGWAGNQGDDAGNDTKEEGGSSTPWAKKGKGNKGWDK